MPNIRIQIANDMMFSEFNESKEMQQAVRDFKPTVRFKASSFLVKMFVSSVKLFGHILFYFFQSVLTELSNYISLFLYKYSVVQRFSLGQTFLLFASQITHFSLFQIAGSWQICQNDVKNTYPSVRDMRLRSACDIASFSFSFVYLI
jgi:hypothetical protein